MANRNCLTQKRLREVLSYNKSTGIFTWIKNRMHPRIVGEAAGCFDGHGYIVIYVDGCPHKAHRLAWLYVHGDMPDCDIDHINRIGADNRFKNLRLASRTNNLCNKPKNKNNSSGFKGVDYVKRDGKWRARISFCGRKICIGYFKNAKSAAIEYDKKAREFHGEFACTNFHKYSISDKGCATMRPSILRKACRTIF